MLYSDFCNNWLKAMGYPPWVQCNFGYYCSVGAFWGLVGAAPFIFFLYSKMYNPGTVQNTTAVFGESRRNFSGYCGLGNYQGGGKGEFWGFCVYSVNSCYHLVHAVRGLNVISWTVVEAWRLFMVTFLSIWKNLLAITMSSISWKPPLLKHEWKPWYDINTRGFS